MTLEMSYHYEFAWEKEPTHSLAIAVLEAETDGRLYHFIRKFTAYQNEILIHPPELPLTKHYCLKVDTEDPDLRQVLVWNHQHKRVTNKVSLNFFTNPSPEEYDANE